MNYFYLFLGKMSSDSEDDFLSADEGSDFEDEDNKKQHLAANNSADRSTHMKEDTLDNNNELLTENTLTNKNVDTSVHKENNVSRESSTTTELVKENSEEPKLDLCLDHRILECENVYNENISTSEFEKETSEEPKLDLCLDRRVLESKNACIDNASTPEFIQEENKESKLESNSDNKTLEHKNVNNSECILSDEDSKTKNFVNLPNSNYNDVKTSPALSLDFSDDFSFPSVSESLSNLNISENKSLSDSGILLECSSEPDVPEVPLNNKENIPDSKNDANESLRSNSQKCKESFSDNNTITKTNENDNLPKNKPLKQAKIGMKKPREKLGERLGAKKLGSRIPKNQLDSISSDSVNEEKDKESKNILSAAHKEPTSLSSAPTSVGFHGKQNESTGLNSSIVSILYLVFFSFNIINSSVALFSFF